MKTLTDEQVVRVLAEREGWEFNLLDDLVRFAVIQNQVTGRVQYVYIEELPKLFPYLTSRDALAPVLAGLGEEEKQRLLEAINRQSKTSWEAMWKTLTLPPADLARAVASVLVEQPKERA